MKRNDIVKKIPDYLTLLRLILAPIIIILGFTKHFIPIIILIIIAAITDFLDGYLARKYNLVTDLGKVMDAIADKVLVNGVLIVLAVEGYISVVVPVVIVSRDIFVDSIKMVAGQKSGAVGASKAGKFKTAFMLVGITLLFFQDIPFSLLGVNFVSRTIIMIATVLSVISGIQYYVKNKKYLFDTK